jgi:hypothetical protein
MQEKPDSIVQLFQQKHDLMQQFLALSGQQAEAVRQEDYELVLAIIEQKQTVIEKVNLLSPLLQEQNGPVDRQLQTIKNQTMEIISRAAALDEQSVQILKRNQDQVLAEMINIKKSHQTHAQYRGDNVKMGGVFLDIKQ